ncbi:MAG: hypothetical protein MUE51_07810 [Thermoleophilia bacterium]|nr:hypothetical protein [Thermoleophilia bacterium]
MEAAFSVLREIVLRDDADDASRRLAELNWAHRRITTLRAVARPGD